MYHIASIDRYFLGVYIIYIYVFHIIKKPYHMTSVGFGVEDWTSQGPSRKLMIPKHSMDYACIVLLATIWF